MKRQQQRQQYLIPSTFSNRSISGDRRKRRREQGCDVFPEPKKKLTVQQREEILAEEQKKDLNQVVSEAPPLQKRSQFLRQFDSELYSGRHKKEKARSKLLWRIAQKQNVTQSASMQSSPQKSAKKALQCWTPKDELAFFKGILSYSEGGKGLPSNMAPVFAYVRPMLDREFRISQLYTKFMQARIKLELITAKIEVNDYSFQKNKYEFDSPYQAALYDIWMQLWGEEGTGGDAYGNYAEAGKGEEKHAEIEARNGSLNFKGKMKRNHGKMKKNRVEANKEAIYKVRSEEVQGGQEKTKKTRIKQGLGK